MRNGVFVTGGMGFVGRSLLVALQDTGRPVTALVRGRGPDPIPTGITVVVGDLLAPDTYRNALACCEVVIHLAAATGGASAEEHTRVNARGTQVLIDECRRADVPNVLFVSSIATTFTNATGYHYAEAKRQAEETVARSGLRYAILRPTIILGPGAPILKALEKLALLPVIAVPGRGRARVQPVAVNDVVRSIIETIQGDLLTNKTFDVGGPDIVTMEELLQHIRRSRIGRAGPVLHVPLGVLRFPLRMAEAVGLAGMLPITAGQLASFEFDGIVTTTGSDGGPVAERVGLSEMLARAEDDAQTGHRQLDAECRVFTRYLLGCDPDHSVISRYRMAHATMPALLPTGRFDAVLLRCARMGSLGAKIADSYASLFLRTATLRRKLVLLLAILETRPPFSVVIDTVPGGSMATVLVRVGLKTTGSLLSLLAGTLIFVPTRAALALMGRGAR